MKREVMVTFTLGGMVFEYDEEHSVDEVRYDTIGDTSAGNIWCSSNTTIGNINQIMGKANDILFVVYTERVRVEENEMQTDIIRFISARLATNFERRIYYGKCK